jgi:hypothetical protein
MNRQTLAMYERCRMDGHKIGIADLTLHPKMGPLAIQILADSGVVSFDDDQLRSLANKCEPSLVAVIIRQLRPDLDDRTSKAVIQ